MVVYTSELAGEHGVDICVWVDQRSACRVAYSRWMLAGVMRKRSRQVTTRNGVRSGDVAGT